MPPRRIARAVLVGVAAAVLILAVWWFWPAPAPKLPTLTNTPGVGK